MLPFLRLFYWILLLSALLGCDHRVVEEDGGTGYAEKKQVNEHSTECFRVAIVGDSSCSALLRTMGRDLRGEVQTNPEGLPRVDLTKSGRTYRLESRVADAIEPLASLMFSADCVVLAVDATVGLLPIHREHVLLARQMHAPTIVIAFTQSGLVDDAELLELEELEARELLTLYQWPGDQTTCVFDHKDARTTRGWKSVRGSLAILECLATVVQQRASESRKTLTKRFQAEGYALATQESFARSTAVGIHSGSARIILGSTCADAKILAEPAIIPGKHGALEIHFDQLVDVHPGTRFALLSEGHVSGVGFVKEIDLPNR